MLILLAPSKTMDLDQPERLTSTEPIFAKEAKQLIKNLKNPALRSSMPKLLQASEAIANRSLKEYKQWGRGPKAQMILAYRGDVYDGLAVDGLDDAQLARINETVRVISGLYGYLRPSDLIERYRLEMKTKLKGSWGNNLYIFWGSKVADQIAAEKPDILVNATSLEYMRTIKPYLPKSIVIVEPKFLQIYPNGTRRDVTFFTKRTRGMLARFLADFDNPGLEEIKKFNLRGFAYVESSPELNPTFERHYVPGEQFINLE